MSQGCQSQAQQDMCPRMLSEASCCPASTCSRDPGQVLSAFSGLTRRTRRGISERSWRQTLEQLELR